MTRIFLTLAAAVPLLAACAPTPVAPPAPPPVALPPVAAVAGISGLEERQPDLCKAGRYTAALGQPAGVIGSLGVDRAYRVVEYRGIEPQEYDPNRIVFRLDQAGRIYNIDCG